MEPYKYLTNFLQMPVVLLVFLVGVVAVLWGIIRTLWKPAFDKGIWFAGAGTVLTVLALLLVAGYNNTAYYPSTHDLQSSLTLANSCSSQFTLKVMLMSLSLFLSFLPTSSTLGAVSTIARLMRRRWKREDTRIN